MRAVTCVSSTGKFQLLSGLGESSDCLLLLIIVSLCVTEGSEGAGLKRASIRLFGRQTFCSAFGSHSVTAANRNEEGKVPDLASIMVSEWEGTEDGHAL